MNKEYEIWSEGYLATGNMSGAHFHGKQAGKSFREACEKFFKERVFFNKENLTIWGCRLYDNEQEARKNFG